MYPCVASLLLPFSSDGALHDNASERERFEGSRISHKIHVDLTGNCTCSRSGGSGCAWEEIKEPTVPFFLEAVSTPGIILVVLLWW